MRHEDVRAGQTYVVRIPQRLPVSRYLAERFGTLWRLSVQTLGGATFTMTVTDTTAEVGGEPMIEGLRVTELSAVTVELTDDQLRNLGLPQDGPDYLVSGQLLDIEGNEVLLPATATLVVPARWLTPMDPERPEFDEPSGP